MNNIRLLLFNCVFLFFSAGLSATVFTSVQDGNWNDGTTWDQGTVPTAADDVIIEGDSVAITSAVSINTISLTNKTATFRSKLHINGSFTVSVTDSLYAFADNFERDVSVIVKGGATLNVGENVQLIRASNNNKNAKLDLQLSGAAYMNVGGDFRYNFQKSANGSNATCVLIDDSAVLTITGKTYLLIDSGSFLDFSINNSGQVILNSDLFMIQTGGKKIWIQVNNSGSLQVNGDVTMTNSESTSIFHKIQAGPAAGSIDINGNLTLTSTIINSVIKLQLQSNPVSGASLSVSGDIILNALDESDVIIDLLSNSYMELGGTIFRSNGYGDLNMSSSNSITFNGTQAQVIPSSASTGGSTDSLYFSNVYFNNTSGLPLTLGGPLVINETMTLTSGIIETSSVNTLTLLDNVGISGGSSTAYIDGPLTKIGGNNGSDFTFPLGDNGIYAPLEMEETSNSSDQYTAQYINNMPADRGSVNSPLTHVSANEYWSFSKSTGSDDVNVTIHWEDAARSGINDINDLVVAMYDLNAPAMGWKSIGQGNYGGSVSANDAGWIVNDLLCPPPIEDGIYTFGSTDNLVNPLPAEILEFTAHKMGEKVMVKWLTTSERNIDNYQVERSTDGINFEMIKKVRANDNNAQENVYYIYDELPANGTNYYRLKQVDKDRSYEYSNIVIVKFYTSHQAILQPNPVADFINLVGLDTEKGKVEIRIFSLDGRLVYLANFEIAERELRIPVSNIIALHTGTYILQYSTEHGPQSIKFVKE